MTDAIVDSTITPDATAVVTPDANTAPEVPDWAKDPVAAAKMVADLRAENARDRTSAKTAAAEEARAELLKQLGLKPDDKPVTPETHQAELSAKDAKIRDLTIKSALSDALSTAGANRIARAAILGDGVLDSLDASADDFAEQVNSKVSAYLTANPELKGRAQAASSSGTDAPGGDKPLAKYTRAQLRDPAFYQANKADIENAYLDGRISD